MAPIFTGLAKGLGGFGFGKLAGGEDIPFSVTGGTTITSGSYEYHVFINPGTLEITGSGLIDILAVGGGGGGPAAVGGGSFIYLGSGGAGGVLHGSQVILASGSYDVSIGSGGPTSKDQVAPSGGNTTLTGPVTYIAYGGGGGGALLSGPPGPGQPGGSGGGGRSGFGNVGGASIQTSQPAVVGILTGYGNPAGNPASANSGGGGGGAGGAGSPPPDSSYNGGPGGAAKAFPQFPAPVIEPAIPAPVRPTWTPAVGPTGLFAGGGGCGTRQQGPPSPTNAIAGSGGGAGAGDGWVLYDPRPGTQQRAVLDAVDYTGSGGGSAGEYYSPFGPQPSYLGGAGGDGIVIIRYLLGQ